MRQLLNSGGADYRIDRNNYSIDDISKKARKFLFEDKYMRAELLASGLSLEFWVGGYSSHSETHELRKITIVNGNCAPPDLLCDGGRSRMFCGGQFEPINRLLIGFDASLEGALSAAGVSAKDIPPLLGMVKARSERFLCNESMPIQDAIDLAEFLVDTTKGFFRFLPGADIVGGDTDVATVTRHERFKWIKRKHYYPAQINVLETDHDYGQEE